MSGYPKSHAAEVGRAPGASLMERHRSWTRTRCGATGALLAGLVLCADARADEATDTAAARALGIAGIALANGGHCDRAIEKLARAEALHHAPSTAERLGECEIDVGRIVAGTERLQRVVREPLAPNAPLPFVAAVARANSVLSKATPRIAMLRINVRAPSEAHVVVTIDGEPLPDAVLRDERPSDPGSHRVGATARGFSPVSEDIVLADGETKTLSLDLQPISSPRPFAIQGPFMSGKDSSSSRSRSPAAAITALTLGGAGIALGAVAGAEVFTKSSALSSACNASGVCPPDRQSDISSAKSWAMLSTVGFVVGGTGLVTGVLLLLTNGSSAASAPKAASVAPVVGATYAGLHGWF